MRAPLLMMAPPSVKGPRFGTSAMSARGYYWGRMLTRPKRFYRKSRGDRQSLQDPNVSVYDNVTLDADPAWSSPMSTIQGRQLSAKKNTAHAVPSNSGSQLHRGLRGENRTLCIHWGWSSGEQECPRLRTDGWCHQIGWMSE